jgi:hypothetical protein
VLLVFWLAGRTGHSRAAAEFAAGRSQTAAQPAGPPRIGITLWRLRPSTSSDPAGVRMLVQEAAAPQPTAWTAERLDPDTPIRENDRLRLGIESQQPGFLYVIDRESYEGGETGEPFLIFPTRRMSAGANQMRRGRLVEIPSVDDRPPYLTVRAQASRYRGELLTVLLSPTPLPELSAADDRRPLDASLFQGLERRWAAQYHREKSGAPGAAITQAEAEARSSTRLLVQDDPAPQTIYTFDSPVDQARLFHFALKIAAVRPH